MVFSRRFSEIRLQDTMQVVTHHIRPSVTFSLAFQTATIDHGKRTWWAWQPNLASIVQGYRQLVALLRISLFQERLSPLS